MTIQCCDDHPSEPKRSQVRCGPTWRDGLHRGPWRLYHAGAVWSTSDVEVVGVRSRSPDGWTDDMDVTFVLNGRSMRLTRDQVEACARSAVAEPVRSHAVEIDGKVFPPKQIFALATGLDRLDFTTMQARTQLIRLGYRVLRVGEQG